MISTTPAAVAPAAAAAAAAEAIGVGRTSLLWYNPFFVVVGILRIRTAKNRLGSVFYFVSAGTSTGTFTGAAITGDHSE